MASSCCLRHQYMHVSATTHEGFRALPPASSHGTACSNAGMCAESEQRRLSAELAVARKETELAQARVADLTAQFEASQHRLTESQALSIAEQSALSERHRAEVAELQSTHARVVSDMQAVHDQTHCQLAAALADGGVLRERVQAAKAAAAQRSEELAAAERGLQAREAQLEVRVWSRSLSCTIMREVSFERKLMGQGSLDVNATQRFHQCKALTACTRFEMRRHCACL